MYLHALHVLAANVKNEAHLRKELLCSLIVRHSLYLAGIYAVSCLDKALSVACDA